VSRRKASDADDVMFDVAYEDGTESPNRRVPAAALGGPQGDGPARAILQERERRIAVMSGRPGRRIRTVRRSGPR